MVLLVNDFGKCPVLLFTVPMEAAAVVFHVIVSARKITGKPSLVCVPLRVSHDGILVCRIFGGGGGIQYEPHP
jgi:hypothetical protein